MKKLFSPHVQSGAAGFHWGMLTLRLAAGLLMIPHGWSKLQKAFAGSAQFADPLGIGPFASLWLAGITETVFAVLVAVGLFTRMATLPLILTMLVAVFIHHANDPIGKKELGLMYLAAYITILLAGGGKLSLDSLRRR